MAFKVCVDFYEQKRFSKSDRLDTKSQNLIRNSSWNMLIIDLLEISIVFISSQEMGTKVSYKTLRYSNVYLWWTRLCFCPIKGQVLKFLHKQQATNTILIHLMARNSSPQKSEIVNTKVNKYYVKFLYLPSKHHFLVEWCVLKFCDIRHVTAARSDYN